METIVELTEYVRGKALEYVQETGEEIETFPLSIVDFVIEHISQNCHFPSYFEEKHIVSAMPPPPMSRDPYHLDPHPHFSPDDSQIIYMTTVLGNIDVAVTPVEQLI